MNTGNCNTLIVYAVLFIGVNNPRVCRVDCIPLPPKKISKREKKD